MGKQIFKTLLEIGEARMLTPGSVYEKKGGKQTLSYAFYYEAGNTGRKRKVVTGNSEQELREKARAFLEKKNAECLEALEETKRAEEEKERPRTFREAGQEWYAEYEKGTRTFSSRESRMCSLKTLEREIGGLLVKDIDSAQAQEAIDRCSVKKDGSYFSKSHVEKLQQVLQMVMGYAVEKGYCDQKPKKARFDPDLKEPSADERFLDREEIKRILDALGENPRYRAVVRLLLATGLRQEEAFALNVKDFREMRDGNYEINICKVVREVEKNKFEIVQGAKTKRSIRRVSLPRAIYEEVMEYYEERAGRETPQQKELREENQTEGTIFVNKDMKPLNKRTFQRNYIEYLRKRGISYSASLHMLRHSYVSFQTEKMSLDKVAKMIGDSAEIANRIYQSLTENTRTEVCENTMDLFNSL